MMWITFKGERFLFTGDDASEGALTSEDAYRSGEAGHAHLFPDGAVRRFGEQIGTRDDIVFGEPADVAVEDVAQFLGNVIASPTWRRPA